MGDLSPHFSRREFDCHDGSRANPTPDLIGKLEALRERCGNKPLRIISGYRSVAWNRHVGGARKSQHLYNRAADIPAGYARLEDAVHVGFTGVGVCNGWVVHVDVRPGKRVVFKDC